MGRKRKGKQAKSTSEAERRAMKMLEREAKEIGILSKRVVDEAPQCGDVEKEKRKFAELPLSQYTQRALKEGKFKRMTQIQRCAIPHALAGRDVLGAAKTGSGKTLAFMIPVIEKLYRHRWGREDGLGALIISPTRELAFQIFEVTRTVGHKHSLSAGLVIGGKSLKEEQGCIGRMNILVATPGRILQHLEQTYDFTTDSLIMFVLDEADRILDMGFKKTLNAIVSFLPPPPQRQTLLFSATQTRRVKDLARLSLRNPEYVAVHDKAEFVTPRSLKQMCVVCPIEEKMNVLFSFIKTHLKEKILVFLSSCKQVKFVFECFRRIRPGVPLMALHGKVKQMKRLAVYEDFQQKKRAVLFATDVAARGLDFERSPLTWVVQCDCPDTAANYVHRVGRTARYAKGGHALLMLRPAEEKMIEVLKEARVPLTKIELNPKKQMRVTEKIRGLVAEDKELKTLAQKAFVSYVRSVHLQPNKAVFDTASLSLGDLATSMGLSSTPRLNFLSSAQTRVESRKLRNENSRLHQLKQELLKERRQQRRGRSKDDARSAPDRPKRIDVAPLGLGDDEDDDSPSADDSAVTTGGLFSKRPRTSAEVERALASVKTSDTRKRKLKIRPSRESENHVFFDESGKKMSALQSLADGSAIIGTDASLLDVNAEKVRMYQERVAAQMDAADVEDRETNRARVREKHKKQRLRKRQRLNEEEEEDEGEEYDVTDRNENAADGDLGQSSDSGGSSDSDDGGSDSDDSGSDDSDSNLDVSSAQSRALALLQRRRKL